MQLMVIDDIMTSLLPEDAQQEIPVGFAIVGHVGESTPTSIPRSTDLKQHT